MRSKLVLLSFGVMWAFSAAASDHIPAKSLVLMGGITEHVRDDCSVTVLGLTTSSKDSLKNELTVGVEANWQPTILGAGIAIERNTFKPSDDSASDIAYSALLIPKLEAISGMVHPWAGFGVGFIRSTIGNQSATDPTTGITMSANDKTKMAFAYSPRVGVDFDLAHKLLIGFQASYSSTKVSEDYGLTIGSTSVGKASIDVTRTWYAFEGRIGLYF